MSRIATVVFCLLFAATAGILSGCGAGPYSAKPERLRKPRKKKRKKPKPVAAENPVPEDTQCRTNFFAEPPRRLKRRAKSARRLARQADVILIDAERASGQRRISAVMEASRKLKSALKKDPYGPEPTYKLAVAYALVGRNSCAIALLDRLNQLQQYPDTEKEAARVIQRATREPAFAKFRKKANEALGE